jgi:hypothetical protein
MVVYELENRGQRSHIIAVNDRISGGSVKVNSANQPVNVYFDPETKIVVTEACGEKLVKGFPTEVKLIKKSNRKE